MVMRMILVLLAILIAACVPLVETQDTPDVAAVEKAEVVEEKEEKVDTKTESPLTGAVVASTELLSDVSCAERMITLTFTNTGSERIKVSDADFIVNGQLDISPECDADTLAAGESTLCSGLDVLGVGKTSVVQVIMPDREQGLKKVSCE